MNARHTLHFIDAEARNRAAAARLAFELGHHGEVYEDTAEMVGHCPAEGIIIARDDQCEHGMAGMIGALSDGDIWLPIIAVSQMPDIAKAVAAIKAGALDYLVMPLHSADLAQALDRVAGEAQAQAIARRRMMEARSRIAGLSHREREVLDWLAEGGSNKIIARALAISPRTVEIHRANLMEKLGARHVTEAVRCKLEADLAKGQPFPARHVAKTPDAQRRGDEHGAQVMSGARRKKLAAALAH